MQLLLSSFKYQKESKNIPCPTVLLNQTHFTLSLLINISPFLSLLIFRQ